MPPSVAKRIARELNISVASVSRALNDQPGVGEELRAVILAKAREFNYTPGVAGRALATSQTFGIGFFVRERPGLAAYSDPFYGEILHGAEEAFARSEYHLTVGTLTRDILTNPASFRFVREGRIDAMLLAGPDIPADFILAMTQTNLPIVLLDNRLEYSKTHSVSSDDEGGACLAAQHLLALGHRRIGVLSGPEAWSSNRRRTEGFRHALSESGLSPVVIHVEQTTMDSGQDAFRQLIAKAPDITGICAINDSMAIGAIRAAQEMGRRVPDDLSVVGFDNIVWATVNHPSLTTIHIPKQQIGLEGANRLLAMLNTPDLEPTNLMVSVRLIERESTAPVKGR
jgi:LacI family transcriptional regulator